MQIISAKLRSSKWKKTYRLLSFEDVSIWQKLSFDYLSVSWLK